MREVIHYGDVGYNRHVKGDVPAKCPKCHMPLYVERDWDYMGTSTECEDFVCVKCSEHGVIYNIEAWAYGMTEYDALGWVYGWRGWLRRKKWDVFYWWEAKKRWWKERG